MINTLPARQTWRPVPYVPPSAHYEAVRPKALGEVTVPASTTLLDSPLLALATDVTAVSASAYLAFNLSRLDPPSGWATFWWIVAAASGVKALHDLARLNA